MSARRNREDKNKNVVNQLQEFANDSVVFFNKCAKPDRNGMLYLTINLFRVHEDSSSMCHGIFSYWVHRIYH